MTTQTLVFNNRRYAPLGSTLPADCNGFYKKHPVGQGKIHLFKADGTVGALLIDNHVQGTFVVTATKRKEGIWYMHSTCSLTDKWLGLDVLGYMETHDAVKGISFVTNEPQTADLEFA